MKPKTIKIDDTDMKILNLDAGYLYEERERDKEFKITFYVDYSYDKGNTLQNYKYQIRRQHGQIL